MVNASIVDYFGGDNLDVILSLIDDVSCEDERFEQELCEALDDVCSEPKDQLKCLHCSKLYKTKRGLTRHLEAKHPSGNHRSSAAGNPVSEPKPKLTSIIFHQIVIAASKKLSEDFCLTFVDRNIFNKFTISTTECELVWENVKDVLLKFNGNMDKFHSQFHKFSLPSTHLFSTLSTQLSALLCSEVSSYV